MARDCLYRAQILEYPEFETYTAFDSRYWRRGVATDQVKWDRPVGWVATQDYIGRFGTDKFFEPDTHKWFKSRSSAKRRVDLLQEMGYTAIVQRSAPVVWPREGQQVVQESEAGEVLAAARVLKKAGLVPSVEAVLDGRCMRPVTVTNVP